MSFLKNIFSSPKPPPAPDYAGAARAQGAANVETARVEGRMNRPDVYSPYDQTIVTDLGDDRFRQDYTLAPEYEAQRQKQVGITNKFLDTAGNYLSGLPQETFSLANLSPQPGLIDRSGFQAIPNMGNIDDYATRVEGAYFDRALNRLQPQFQQQEIDLRTQLINSGIPEGSDAYNAAIGDLRMQQNDSLRDLAQESIREGQALADAQLQRATGLRSFQIGDAEGVVREQERIRDRQLADYLLSRNQPLTEIAALSGQAPPPPSVATTGLNVPAVSVAPPPIFAAAQQQGQFDQGSYAGQVGAYGARLNALGDAAASGATLAMLSDKRLKKNIKFKSKSKSGLNIYEFEYNWSPERYTGVIAQDIKKIKPSAISENIFGHLMVDYNQIDVTMERV